jgi:hypothetical protein
MSKKVHFCDFWARKIFWNMKILLKMTHIGVILCGESIKRIPEAKNGSLTLIQGMDTVYERKKKIFDFRVNKPNPFPESRKRFHASEMRSIDFPHKITPIWVIFSKKFLVPKNFFGPQKCTFFDSSCSKMRASVYKNFN